MQGPRQTPRDQRAVDLIEELIITTRHMNAKKRSWFVLRLEEGLNADSWAAKHTTWTTDDEWWLGRIRALYAAKRASGCGCVIPPINQGETQ